MTREQRIDAAVREAAQVCSVFGTVISTLRRWERHGIPSMARDRIQRAILNA